MEVVIDNEEYQISILDNLKASFLKFKKKPASGGLRSAYTQLVEIFSKNKLHKHMTDTSLMGVVSIEDQKWVSGEVVPKLKSSINDSDELQIALILGADVFSAFGAKNMAKKAKQMSLGLKINFFSNKDEADVWLRSMD